MTSLPRLSVVIPVYNEKKTIERLIQKVISVYPPDKEVIVVDDCSTDGTSDILKRLAEEHGFVFIRHERNMGKGDSFRDGLRVARGEMVIPQDADLELDPAEYEKLMFPILEGKADAVFGSRLLRINKEAYTFKTLLANKLFVWITNILYRGRFTDIMTCYKICRRDVWESLDLVSHRFDMEPEIACKLMKKNYRVTEVPVAYYPRGWDEGKKIRCIDTFGILLMIIKLRFSS